MQTQRLSGILLHPTSLPGGRGIGTLGADARQFVDFLAGAGQRLWQVCPLGPTGYGDSPYASFSAFAGNPLLIDLDELAGQGLLEPETLDGIPPFPPDRVDYGMLIPWKFGLLRDVAEGFEQRASAGMLKELQAWTEKQADWLDDYARFMAAKEAQGGAPWTQWPRALRDRDPQALEQLEREQAAAIRFHRIVQFLFDLQWRGLRTLALERGIILLGDMPFFPAHDSADCWARRDIFDLDAKGNPRHVAGVPPDAFSETGQRWGNPLFRWDSLADCGYDWWIARIRRCLEQTDYLRLDHFRAFEAFWQIPAGDDTAENGRWVTGPGKPFFHALERALGGDLPLVAEDLGLITPPVETLRRELDLPGMKVLQFAFGEDPHHEYLPHNYEPGCVAYTGTHDNDTTTGWFAQASDKVREQVQRYLWVDGSNVAWDLMHAATNSVAHWVVFPMQDTLALGSEARLNHPGRAEGNWCWRLRRDQLHPDLMHGLREMAWQGGRLPRQEENEEQH